jgi:hypothetical protein
MRNLQKQIGEKKYAITILAVHLETWPEVQSFLRSNNSLFEGVNVSRVGLGVHGLNVLGPEIKALPALFLIDKQGRIAGRWSGYIPGQLTQRLLNLYNER